MYQITLVVFSSLVLFLSQPLKSEPVNIIFDTDMGNDVDDALALALLHAFENRNESKLLAITLTKDHPEVAPYIQAINTFYGRSTIPIGITKSGITPEPSLFTPIIHNKVNGQSLYPFQHAKTFPNAVNLLRETLAGQPDNSVVIVQVGFSTNLAALLKTSGDHYSPLNGVELVKKKVKLVSAMAGAFTEVWGGVHLEYNIVNDIPSAQYFAKFWPAPIIWSGFEVGLAVRYPAVSILNDFNYLQYHPISESYQRYKPSPHERPSWDLTSVIQAIRAKDQYFDLSQPGKVTVASNGETTFKADTHGLHQYLRLKSENKIRIQELMRLLVSEPPKRVH